MYAVGEYFPGVVWLYGLAGRVLAASAIVSIAYGVHSFKEYLSSVAVFFATTFAFGGAVYAVATAINGSEASVPMKIVAVSFAVVFVAITALTKQYLRKINRERVFVEVKAEMLGKEATFTALVDTGCSICDPLSDAFVVVVEEKAIDGILPGGLDIDAIDPVIANRVRLIPYRSVGNSKGVLPAVRPDCVYIDGKKVVKPIIAVYKGNFSGDGMYHAIVGVNYESACGEVNVGATTGRPRAIDNRPYGDCRCSGGILPPI